MYYNQVNYGKYFSSYTCKKSKKNSTKFRPMSAPADCRGKKEKTPVTVLSLSLSLSLSLFQCFLTFSNKRIQKRIPVK